MHIAYGYVFHLDCAQRTPILLKLDVHPDFHGDLVAPDQITATELNSGTPIEIERAHLDAFGNVCRRLVAPPGRIAIQSQGVIFHSGSADEQGPGAIQHAPEELPTAVLGFLKGSRYCETDLLAPVAWQMFGGLTNGWDRVVAITDFVHRHVRFDYMQARDSRTAFETYSEQVGVCRDFAHLAVAFCRALNIPARYCNGYLGDIGVTPDPAPMDFSAWFEVFLGGRWWTFDARHNIPRIGRIVIARGLDAADVPMITSFGQHQLQRFEVVTEELTPPRPPLSLVAGRAVRAPLFRRSQPSLREGSEAAIIELKAL